MTGNMSKMSPSGGAFSGVFSLLRIRQWVKNAFVLSPLIFLYDPERIGCIDLALLVFAFVSFCLLSSSVYCINDIFDRDADRLHPRKCRRPLASGVLSVTAALWTAAVLILLPLLGGLALGISFPELKVPLLRLAVIEGLYFVNNIIYCVCVRQWEILDVFSIALGFALRLLAGCCALQSVPSHWLLLCGFSLALLLGFGKRRMELALDSENKFQFRMSLQFYTPEFLNILLAITAATTLIIYVFYAISSETILFHHTKNLIYTAPFVLFGIFRFISASIAGHYDGADELLFCDKLFLLDIILWFFVVVGILFI